MADRAQLMEALRAADAAGDTAAAQAIARRLSATPAQAAPAQQPQSAPAQQPQSFGEQAADFAGNFAKGAVGSVASLGSNIIRAGTAPHRMLLKTLGVDDNPVSNYIDRIPKAAQWMRDEAKGVGGFLGELTGDVAATAGVGGAALKAAKFLPMAQRAVSAPLAAAGTGMIGGAMTAPEDHAKAALTGAAGGVVGQQLLSRTLGRLAAPLKSTHHADSDALIQGGVPLTAGMAADPNSWSGRLVRFIEESAASFPGAGAGVKAQREAARAGFRDMPMREVAQQAGINMPARSNSRTTADMLEGVHDAIGQRYDSLLRGRTIRPTQVFRSNLDNAVMDPKLGMTPDTRQRASNLVQAQIWDRAKDPATGQLPTHFDMADLFQAQSDLRRVGGKAARHDLSDENAYGQALLNSADEVYNFIQRRFPQTGSQLQDLRAPYARLSTLDAASRKAGARGEFSPEQLGRAAIERGDKEMRHLAAMAEPLITKDPSLLGAAARAALLTGSSALIGPASVPVAAGMHLMLGTRTGQRALTGQLASQQRLADLLLRRAGTINEAGAIAGREAALETK